MPWKCPGCHSEIPHDHAISDLPRTDRLYRCPVCHTEMTFDTAGKKMKPVKVPPDGSERHKRDVA
jgi:hypothetical protein